MTETQVYDKKDIRNLSEKQLKEWLKDIGEPAFRAQQIYRWLWQKGAQSFDEMTNLSKKLRALLDKHYEFRLLKEDVLQHSSDGTIKIRYTLHDGHRMETVLIPVPEQDRYTVCVSCQVGCSLSCAFCATGQLKRERNLSAAEIYDQVALVNEKCLEIYGKRLTNIVYMGMGEPLLNYKNVVQSIRYLTEENGLHYSAKRITVSTAGISKMIKRLADEDLKVNLALSLHAADDEKRNKIMPISEHNTLEALMEALEYFFSQTKNRISYEYITFAGFNDSIEDARKLVRLCRYFPVRVNIIEYNPIEGFAMHKSSPEQIDRFAQYLNDKGITVTVRRSRGKDIDAACGQLANKK